MESRGEKRLTASGRLKGRRIMVDEKGGLDLARNLSGRSSEDT